MTYKRQFTTLLTIIAVLALAYIVSVVFEPERVGSRSAAFTWLDPKLATKIEKITVSGAGGDPTELVRKNGAWFVQFNGKDYPARQLRVDDFIAALTKRAPYPVRASSAAAIERLGLSEGAASRITVSDGAGQPLLDLLVGQGDQLGREVYLRKAGQNEARSGEDQFTAYTSGRRASWYNLRLFPDSGDGALDASAVQRLTVYRAAATAAAADDGSGGGEASPAETRVFTRNAGGWSITGLNIAEPDMGEVDVYVREIIGTEGEDFSDTIDPADPMFNDSRVTLELEDGSVKTIRLGPPGEGNRRFAVVSGSDYVYSLAGWAAERLFKDAASFEKKAPPAAETE